jgi:hypothetical protein
MRRKNLLLNTALVLFMVYAYTVGQFGPTLLFILPLIYMLTKKN